MISEAHLLRCRVSIPLILSLPATVLSLTRKDQLKVFMSVYFRLSLLIKVLNYTDDRTLREGKAFLRSQ